MQTVFVLRYIFSSFNLRQIIGKQPTEEIRRPTPSKSDSKYKQLYAIVVGINDYATLSPLAGAAADADAVEDFLKTDLKVPANQIISLRNSAASRSAIVLALQSLCDDTRIQKGDPILVYFAGHGGSSPARESWKTAYGYSNIQVIFPCDYNTKNHNSGEVINCIPDRTIRVLLNQLAAAKGNNITVIFDCCHSASGTRAGDSSYSSSDRIARQADVQIDIPEDIDTELLPSNYLADRQYGDIENGGRDIRLPLYADQTSHVHFAACGSEEKAWEERGKGVFTTALLTCIRNSRLDQATYQAILDKLPRIQQQSPNCYGLNKSRVLFSSCLPNYKNRLIPAKLEGGKCILQAGLASGVLRDSLWQLHAESGQDSQALGLFQAHIISVSATVLAPEPNTMRPALLLELERMGFGSIYARHIPSDTGTIGFRVHLSHEAKVILFPAAFLPQTTNTERGEIKYTMEPDRSCADLMVELDHSLNDVSAGTQVTFTLCNPQAKRYGVALLRHTTPAQWGHVESVLSSAALWHWHLRRTGPSDSESILSMEFLKLGEMYGDYMMPTSESPKNLNQNGTIDLKVKPEDQYGIRLYNRGAMALYIRVFYFDMADFSIIDMFGHSRANGYTEPDILPSNHLTLGDGSDGGALLSFNVSPGTEIEVGFLKIFWSTEPLELDELAQGSAFEFEPLGINGRKVGLVNRRSTKIANWGTLVVTVVQRA